MSKKHVLTVISLGLLGSAALAQPVPVGTAFTYQGRLVEGGQPAAGLYALRFTLWDEATRGLRLGEPQIDDRVVVSNGLFTVTLDFGVDPPFSSYFRGDARWLEIGVEHYRGTNYVTLAPRQPLTPTPYAIYAGAAGTAIPADNSVTSIKIVDGQVMNADLADNSVNAAKIVDGSVTSAKILNGAILNADLADNSVNADKIADGSVTSAKIADNAVAAVDLASEVASLHKVSGGHLTVTPTGNLGLGTASPAYPLDVRAGQAVGQFLSTNGSEISVLVLGNTAASAPWMGAINFKSSSGTPGQISYGTNTGLTFDAGGAERLRITPDGNVGLGISTPGFPLNFASSTGDKISLYGHDTGTNHYGFGIQSGLLQIHGSTAGADIAFGYGSSTNFTEQMRIKGSGNVGINKPNPSTTLDVNGTVTATAFVGPGAGLTGIILADNSVTSAKIADNAVATVDLANNAVTSAKILDGTVAAVDLASEVGSLNKVSGGHMTVTPAGNVGLGTATPAWPLDVRAGEAVGRFLSTSISSVSFLELGNTVPTASFLGAINFSTSSGTPPGQIAYDRTDGLTFRAGGAEQVRITPAGNLGLGTAAPAWPLDVRAGQAVGRFLSTNGPSVSFLELGNTVPTASLLGAINFSTTASTSGTPPGQIAYDRTDGLTFRAGLAERVRITPAGNVGIGTATPAWPLDVRAGQAVGRFLSTNGPSVSFLELGNTVASAPLLGAINFNNSSNTTPGQIAYSPTNGLTFRAGGAERLQITPAGSVVLGDGGVLNLYNHSGSPTLGLSGDSSGNGYLGVRDSLSQTRVSLGTDAGFLGGLHGGKISVFGDKNTETIQILGTADAANTGGQIVFKQGNGTTSIQIDGEVSTAGGGYMRLYKGNGTAGITLQAQDGNGDGCITTQVIEITGGSDLSERFDVKPTTLAPTPGMLVSIDPEQPGRLAVSTRAYDRTVAGVISGAGGVKSGMLMSQHGSVASGQHPVALSGRTYCLVDAGSAAIEPGDLITTSDTPGHGMKASDPTRAQGAIIGKAMTRLETGCGLVLVLVTLQ